MPYDIHLSGVSGCGACCKLGPIESRPDLGNYLKPADLEKYKSMIGDDDWCVHYDKDTRRCGIYDNRPSFCKVDVKSYEEMYGIEASELSDFCAFCCRENIHDVYGENSVEMVS